MIYRANVFRRLKREVGLAGGVWEISHVLVYQSVYQSINRLVDISPNTVSLVHCVNITINIHSHHYSCIPLSQI